MVFSPFFLAGLNLVVLWVHNMKIQIFGFNLQKVRSRIKLSKYYHFFLKSEKCSGSLNFGIFELAQEALDWCLTLSTHRQGKVYFGKLRFKSLHKYLSR